jgi:hypothetical protein
MRSLNKDGENDLIPISENERGRPGWTRTIGIRRGFSHDGLNGFAMPVKLVL